MRRPNLIHPDHETNQVPEMAQLRLKTNAHSPKWCPASSTKFRSRLAQYTWGEEEVLYDGSGFFCEFWTPLWGPLSQAFCEP